MESGSIPNKWNNIKFYNKEDYLPDEKFIQAKTEVRRCWRTMGMLQLRMVNDLDRKLRKKLPIPEILERLDKAEAIIAEIRAICGVEKQITL